MKKLLLAISIIFAYTASAAEPWTGRECIVKSEFIWQTGDISAISCHASSIAWTKNGLLATWFAGTNEGHKDVGIWISCYNNGQWSKPVEVADGIINRMMRHPCWNPVLYNSGDKVLLFYKVGPSPAAWWGMMKTSDDDGKTWSSAVRLPKNILGPIKNKPILLDNKELLCPSSTENDGWKTHMEFTHDLGRTWERTAALNDKSLKAIQPTILIHHGGKLQMLCRTDSGKIYSSESIDNGFSWIELYPTSLPNPNSGIDAVTLKDGKHLLVYNHIAKGRHTLNVAVSEDGEVWEAAVLLENEQEGAEFSYPAVIQTNDGSIHITYTWNRKLIKHVVIDPEKIKTAPMQNNQWPDEK